MKNSKTTLLATVAAAIVACMAFAPQAQAVPIFSGGPVFPQAGPITGGISLAGGYTTNTGNLNTATSFTSFASVSVISASGSYTGTAGSSVMMNGFQFNPFTAPVTPLWTFTSGGLTYSFNLNTLTSVTQPGDNTLGLRGLGTLMITGYDPTPGIWIFTANQGGGTFSFSSSNAAVPDGGSAIALLGVGLLGLGALRRKIAS